jgi:hypothetical protein
MQLVIRENRLIKDVQHDFTAVYPFLKIEFFKNGMERKDRYPAERLISPARHIKDAWFRKNQEGDLEFNDTMSVLDLEKSLMDQFGLSAQVFRKSGTIWLETTLTDHWTLKQQNDHGREISMERRRPGPEEYDYD